MNTEQERAFEQILHSVQQAQIPGNDWRRELKLIESTCRAALQSQDAEVARLQAVAQAVADALTMYERYGEVCPFEGEPMIHASTLVDLGELARAAIEHFLNQSGQYITNDASRQAAIDAAIESDRQRRGEPVDPYKEWTDYAKRSGLLNDDGIAPEPARAQTAWNAFSFAWNRSYRVNAAPQPAESTELPSYKDEDDFHQNASTAELGAYQRGWNACREPIDLQPTKPTIKESLTVAEPVKSIHVGWRYRLTTNDKWTLTDTIPVGVPPSGEIQAVYASQAEPVKVPSDLANRLRIKAGVITMGEKIAWGSDVELMLQAAQALESYGQPAQPDETEQQRIGVFTDLLKRTSIALKGPEADHMHDWSDLPEVAARAVEAAQRAVSIRSLKTEEAFNSDIPVTEQEEEEWKRIEYRK